MTTITIQSGAEEVKQQYAKVILQDSGYGLGLGVDIYLQARSKGESNFSGMIGLFGGKLKEGETFKQCALRELHEETGLSFYDTSLTLLGIIDSFNDDAKPSIGHTYSIINVTKKKVSSIRTNEEGSLFKINLNEAAKLSAKRLTPIASFALGQLCLLNSITRDSGIKQALLGRQYSA
ncbi:MAG: NUDIX domain-containing protein [Parvularculaceae bacterium]|nr:NUDIX domain-containing protein [Parvularculaceae bacterium]